MLLIVFPFMGACIVGMKVISGATAARVEKESNGTLTVHLQNGEVCLGVFFFF